MADGNAGIGHFTLNHIGQIRQGRYAVAHDEQLSVAAHLKVDGLADDIRAVDMNLGLYGITVGRRSLYDGEVTGTHKRELQGTRYWRGGHCEHIHVGAHLLQALLDRYAELLLLIDNEQTQVLELDLFAYQLVRSYYDIYLA